MGCAHQVEFGCAVKAAGLQSRMKMGHPISPGAQESTMRAGDFLASRGYFVHTDILVNK